MTWTFLLLAALLASRAFAAGPYVVADVVAGVGQCGVFLDAAAKVAIPVTAVTGGNICQYDLATVAIAPGTHSITMSAIPSDPASLESGPSAPLSFTWPVPIPARPAGLRLRP